jgi:succinate-semialdehyde dehydrogenase/glutarate-semialdehyde dehydrogenase
MTFESRNPTTGEVIGRYEETSREGVDKILRELQSAFERWRRADFSTRAALMRKAGVLLRERQDALARLMAEEMGKPLAQGRAEVEKCAWACDFYAGRRRNFSAPRKSRRTSRSRLSPTIQSE